MSERNIPREVAEEVAEEVARSRYDLTEEEVSDLVEAEAFLKVAVTRRAISEGIPEPHVDPEDPRGVEDLTPTEVAMLREGTALLGSLSQRCDDRAAEVLGEYPERLSFEDRLARHTEGGVEGGETA